MRWSEELRLLEEEMRRVLAYLDWDIGVWRNRALDVGRNWPSTSKAHAEGLIAYACRQAWIRGCLKADFEFKWVDAPTIFRLATTYHSSPSVTVGAN
jgi:hypothetical protein